MVHCDMAEVDCPTYFCLCSTNSQGYSASFLLSSVSASCCLCSQSIHQTYELLIRLKNTEYRSVKQNRPQFSRLMVCYNSVNNVPVRGPHQLCNSCTHLAKAASLASTTSLVVSHTVLALCHMPMISTGLSSVAVSCHRSIHLPSSLQL